MVLDNCAGASLDSQDASDLADDVLGGCPLVHAASELDTDDLGGLDLPGQASHHIHSICSTHTHCAHAQAASIGCVRVCADHHASWEGIVLQHNLQRRTA